MIALLAFALAVLSLGWQVLTHFLTGDKAKVELRVGAVTANGTGIVTMPPTSLRPDSGRELAQQGFTRPVIAVRVRNVGRLPVTVASWGVRTSPGGTELQPLGDAVIGPPLRHRLEAGETETWAVDVPQVAALAEVAKEVFGGSAVLVTGKVELGDGRTYQTGESIRF